MVLHEIEENIQDAITDMCQEIEGLPPVNYIPFNGTQWAELSDTYCYPTVPIFKELAYKNASMKS